MFQILGCLLRAAVVVATWTQRQQVVLLIKSSTHQQLLTIRLQLRQLQPQLTTTGTEAGNRTISNTTHTTSLPKVQFANWKAYRIQFLLWVKIISFFSSFFPDHPDVYTASASASIAPPPSSEEALWRNAAAVADASAAVGEAVSHFNCYWFQLLDSNPPIIQNVWGPNPSCSKSFRRSPKTNLLKCYSIEFQCPLFEKKSSVWPWNWNSNYSGAF